MLPTRGKEPSEAYEVRDAASPHAVIDALFSVLEDGTFYQSRPATAA